MNRRASNRRFAAMASFALGLGGLAFAGAQSGGAPTGAEDPTASTLEVGSRAALTPQQQLAEGEATLRRGQDLSQRVSSLLAEAREGRDIIRVTCVNDKLTQINANVRTVESRLQSLRDAVNADDPGRRNHEFTVISVLGQKFAVLDREANQCIGQDMFETGSTVTETVIDPSTPEDDPGLVQAPAEPTVPFVPPPASGTM